MQAISITNLCKTYKAKKGQTTVALKNLCLQIDHGEVFGFLGPNGAGKSTTIKILLDLIRPSSGSATLSGIDISSSKARRTVGYLPENPTYYDFLSAEEYLLFTGKMYGMKKKELLPKIETLLHKLSLYKVRKKTLRTYSKGMVQRLGIAQVLVHDPDIYILDEPMSGLDPFGRALVKEIILELKKAGKCVFLSSHIIADVEKICDRIGIIAEGNLLSVEQVADVMQKGILGYTIHTTLPNGTMEEEVVQKEQLSTFLSETDKAQREITLIEPVRKDLEQYFLELVTREQK